MQNEENNSPVYSQRSTSANTRKRSTGSLGKSKRTKPSDGDQDVTTTTYQLPQFTDNEIVRIMCSVNSYPHINTKFNQNSFNCGGRVQGLQHALNSEA